MIARLRQVLAGALALALAVAQPLQAGPVIDPFKFAAAGPPFSAVVFLSGFEGADASTSFVDESSAAHALTTNGDAQVDTAQLKYGASSVLLDGTGDYLQAADSADWDFGSGPFTVEAWINVNSLSNGTRQLAGIVGQGELNGSNLIWVLRLTNSPANGLIFEIGNGTGSGIAASVQETFAFTLGTWYHVAADRDASGVLRLYINCTMVDSTTYGSALNTETAVFKVGRTSISSFNRDFDGHIDEVRVTKGYAHYGSDAGCTLPPAAFPRS